MQAKQRFQSASRNLWILVGALIETVLFPMAAAYLVARAMIAAGLTEWMTPVMWLVAAPAVYCTWVLVYLAICAIQFQILFWGYSKPRHCLIVQDAPDSVQHVRLPICYLRSYLLRSLPMMQGLIACKPIRTLYLLAYSKRTQIGTNFVLAGFMYDPDLTEIGDDVVMGGGSNLCAHAFTIVRTDERTYVSAPIRIGDRATIGGESRIAMGVTIGPDAVVEAFSNVVPLTTIGPGEVWGGNPAVFLRHRSDLAHRRPVTDTPPALQSGQNAHLVHGDAGALVEARRIVALALNLSPEAASEKFLADRPGQWDSLEQMTIALTLAEVTGCRLTGDQMFGLCTLSDVARAIGNQSVARQSPAADAALELPADPEWLPLLPSAATTQLLAAAEPPAAVGERVSIVVAASFTAEPLLGSLRRWSAAFGIETRVEFCGFNQIVPALLAPDSLFRGNASGLNVVLTRLEDLGDSPAAAREAASEILSAIGRFASSAGGSARLVVGSLPPVSPSVTGAERRELEALRVDWTEQLSEIEGVDLLDFGAVIERIGLAAAGDVALEVAARAPYSGAAYRELGIELARLVRSRRHPSAKVLALDCDGVLWGGVLGEDGFDGIQIGPDGPGRSYQLFQRALLKLKQRGVLLTLVSRNEESDVLEVLDKHPGMVLRRQDIAGWRINWNPKSQNLRELADKLKLGLDAFVFMDDDPAQRLQVESHLPAVHVFPTPVDPAQYATALAGLWIFDSSSLTAEDSARTEMLTHERARDAERASAENLEVYLAGLDLRVEMRLAEPQDVSRVAQLIGKTNQFNLSLRRRTLEEIKGLGNDYSIYILSAVDRWGDYGQIGVCILRTAPTGEFEIDTFLVSCRALGRGIEQAFLHGVLELARGQASSIVLAPWVEGPRNAPARSFFSQSGFTEREGQIFAVTVNGSFALPSHIAFRLKERGCVAATGSRKN